MGHGNRLRIGGNIGFGPHESGEGKASIINSTYARVLKASPELAEQTLPPKLTLDLFITTGRYEILMVFDSQLSAPVYPPMSWEQYLSLELNQFKTQLMQILDANAAPRGVGTGPGVHELQSDGCTSADDPIAHLGGG